MDHVVERALGVRAYYYVLVLVGCSCDRTKKIGWIFATEESSLRVFVIRLVASAP